MIQRLTEGEFAELPSNTIAVSFQGASNPWILRAVKRGKKTQAWHVLASPLGEAPRDLRSYRFGVDLGHAGLRAALTRAAEMAASLDSLDSGTPRKLGSVVSIQGTLWAVCLQPSEPGSPHAYGIDSNGDPIVTIGPLTERARRASAYRAGLELNQSVYAEMIGIGRTLIAGLGSPQDEVKL
jgi:hypothetical protein